MTHTVETRPLSEVRTHPAQHIYGDLPAAELAALIRDIRNVGLRQPIEITGDNVVIDGHQRCKAVDRLGWTEIPVVVVDVADEHDRDEKHIRANLHRRQLTIIDRARAARELAEIESRRRADGKVATGRVTDAIAQELGCSGRTAARYLRLLRTPRAIQDIVGREELGLTQALRIASLDEAEQREIVKKILAGENPKQVVEAALAPPAKPKPTPLDEGVTRYADLLRQIEHTSRLSDYADPHDLAANTHTPNGRVEIIERGLTVLHSMLEAEKQEEADRKKRRKAMRAEYPNVVGFFDDDDSAADDQEAAAAEDEDDSNAPTVEELLARPPLCDEAAAALEEADRWSERAEAADAH